jgi:putative flippase GtrA
VTQFVRFVLVGILNTAWGYLLIFGFMYFFSLSPTLSNALGYAIGLISSYLLNRLYTFRSKNSKRSEFSRFLVVFGLAYGANYAALRALLSVGLNPYLSQLAAGIIYVLTSYLLGRAFVFKARRKAGA